MALIVGSYASEAAFVKPSEEASKFYFALDSDYCDVYEMSDGDKFLGKILSVGESRQREIKELEGEDISFVLHTPGRIYISKDVYNRAFRKYGLVKEGFWLKAKLNKAVVAGKEIEIYSKRNVEARD